MEALRQIEGAYALVCLTNEMLIGARDPVGIRPLVIGRLGSSYVLASETCALDMVGAEFLREVENGEVVVITEAGLESHRPFPCARRGPASSNTSISRGPTPSSTGEPSTTSASRWACSSRARRRRRRRRDRADPGLGRPRGHRLRASIRTCPSSSASSATTTSAAPSSSREQRIRALGVKLKHSAPTPASSAASASSSSTTASCAAPPRRRSSS